MAPTDSQPQSATRVLLAATGWTSNLMGLLPVIRRAGAVAELLAEERNSLRLGVGWERRTLVAKGDAAAWCGALRAAVEDRKPDLVVVGDEPALDRLLERLDEPWVAGVLPFREPETWAAAVTGKDAWLRAMRRIGVPVPETESVATPDQAVRVAGDLGGEVMLKGLHGSAGGEVRRPRSEREVERMAKWLLRTHAEVLVQRRIAGPVGSAHALAWDGTVVAADASYKARCCRGGLGPSTVRHFAAPVDLIFPHLQRVVEQTKFRGFCGFDFVHETATGRVYAIDGHFRPSAGIGLPSRILGYDAAGAMGACLQGRVGPSWQPSALSAGGERVVLWPQYVRQMLPGERWRHPGDFAVWKRGLVHVFPHPREWVTAGILAADWARGWVIVGLGEAKLAVLKLLGRGRPDGVPSAGARGVPAGREVRREEPTGGPR